MLGEEDDTNSEGEFIAELKSHFKGENGVSCTDDYVYFEVNEKDIVNGNFEKAR